MEDIGTSIRPGPNIWTFCLKLKNFEFSKLYNVILRKARNLLETRENIKIVSQGPIPEIFAKKN